MADLIIIFVNFPIVAEESKCYREFFRWHRIAELVDESRIVIAKTIIACEWEVGSRVASGLMKVISHDHHFITAHPDRFCIKRSDTEECIPVEQDTIMEILGFDRQRFESALANVS